MQAIPLPDGTRLAADVDRRDPACCWVYVHGFGSDRKGNKVSAFSEAAAAHGVSFVAFDARGHGESPGSIEDLTLTRLLEDMDAVVAGLVPPTARLVLVGSSLGGLACAWWAATRTRKPDACVLIAPAFAFMPRFLSEIGPEQTAVWQRTGVLAYKNEWMEVPLRWDLVTDARSYDERRLAATYATDTLILHGVKDERVPWRVSADFVEACPHRPMDLVLLGDGDHRLQERARDLPRLATDFLRAHGLLTA